MSVFQNAVDGLQEISFRITDATAVNVVDGTDGAWFVPSFQVNENSGGTPTLTVSITDGTSTRFLGANGVTYRSKAMTADQSILFDAGYVIPVGWFLKVKSNNAGGLLDVIGTQVKRVTGG